MALESVHGLASCFSSATMAMVALSMPRFRSIGFMPAATAFRPSLTMAWARTVAVVVPSPARRWPWRQRPDQLGAHVLEAVLQLDFWQRKRRPW